MNFMATMLLAALILIPLAALAGSPENGKSLAKEFLATSGVAYWYDEDIKYGLADVLEQEYLKMVPAKNRKEARKAIDQAVAQVRWKSVEDRVAESLAKDFTVKELKDMIKFFQTPAGQKLTKIPLERRVNAVTKELVKSPMLRLRDQIEKLSKQ